MLLVSHTPMGCDKSPSWENIALRETWFTPQKRISKQAHQRSHGFFLSNFTCSNQLKEAKYSGVAQVLSKSNCDQKTSLWSRKLKGVAPFENTAISWIVQESYPTMDPWRMRFRVGIIICSLHQPGVVLACFGLDKGLLEWCMAGDLGEKFRGHRSRAPSSL